MTASVYLSLPKHTLGVECREVVSIRTTPDACMEYQNHPNLILLLAYYGSFIHATWQPVASHH